MKSKFLIISLTLLAYSSYGQSLEFTDKVLDKMVLDVNLDGSGMVTKELDQELKLTQEQYKTVDLVNKQRFQKIAVAEEKFASDPELLQKSYNEINSKSDKELSTVLTEEQMARYMKLALGKNKFYYSSNQHE